MRMSKGVKELYDHILATVSGISRQIEEARQMDIQRYQGKLIKSRLMREKPNIRLTGRRESEDRLPNMPSGNEFTRP